MPEKLHYRVSMENPETHYYSVTIDAPFQPDTDVLRFKMPSWTPGSYMIRDFARNVLEFRAIDSGTGADLTSYKAAKNAWNVEVKGKVQGVKISYKVYAFEYTVDTSYLDELHGIINGASVFMYVEGFEKVEHLLTVVPYSKWKRISTSLDLVYSQERMDVQTFSAADYDILVDSPIEIGNQEIYSFVVKGVTHEISLFGERMLNDESFVADLSGIAEKTWQIFGTIPYKRYVFIVDFASGGRGGGLEHLASTHCIVQRFRLSPPQEYHRLLGLFSHEFFHAWNVKRMRPEGLGPFDYTSETYTKSLWIAEGFTSYYDDLILRNAGIYTPAEYLDAFCVNIDSMKSLPGYRYESAEESSFDTWIRHYRQDENSPNVHGSYYNQGAVIAWMIDMEIRKSTHNSKTLDDALRVLYEETFVKANRGYKENELEEICNRLAGKSLSHEIFDSRVRGREEIDFDKFLGYAGLKLEAKDKKGGSPKGYLGFKIKSESGRVLVSSRLFGSPAEACGIASGDEIIAINNFRVDATLLPFLIANSRPKDQMELLVARDSVLYKLRATVGETPEFEHRIIKAENATLEQKSLFQAWLNASWDLPLEYVEYIPSPQRPKIFDYI